MDCSAYLFEGQGSAGEQPECQPGAKGSQEGNRAPGEGRLPWSHLPLFAKLRGLGQRPNRTLCVMRISLVIPG